MGEKSVELSMRGGACDDARPKSECELSGSTTTVVLMVLAPIRI